MTGKYDTQKGLLSELQWEILRHVCGTKNADYKSICGSTGKGRTTIIQSIKPLVKLGHINEVRTDPSQKKTKLTFQPTYKGKSYIWDLARPPMTVNEILRTETDTNIVAYLQILNQISESSQREVMLSQLASSLLNSLVIDGKGNIKPEAKIRLVKEAFQDGLLDIIQNPKYDARGLFNDTTLRWLIAFFSNAEIKELIGSLRKIENNAGSTAQILSKNMVATHF